MWHVAQAGWVCAVAIALTLFFGWFGMPLESRTAYLGVVILSAALVYTAGAGYGAYTRWRQRRDAKEKAR